ncbi:MAG TPA: inorganic phosphate transporter [Caulobacteraceae bacterium]|nr:inorganic phosphate transporter [Caulobacteraceae bacterium]
MAEAAVIHDEGAQAGKPDLSKPSPIAARAGFLVMLLVGVGYVAFGVRNDVTGVGETVAFGAFALLGLALLIALGFEFVNGFHDTANAVATVIYTHSLPPTVAVVYSGLLNLTGVLLSTGAVAFTIVTLLPVELILQVGSQAGYAMIFALLLAAIIWNLGTWWLGIPNSSSHALIGSIMGVGLANQLMAPAGQATSGVDWSQAGKVFQALGFSPLVGFLASALLLLVMKFLIRTPTLYQEPKADQPPPWWIRGLLILTCGSVSFAHGSNDGQKGMGLIMLILIGAAPTAYALNRTMPDSGTPKFVAAAQAAQGVFVAHAGANPPPITVDQARGVVGEALRTKKVNTPQVFDALGMLSGDITEQVKTYGSVKHVPAAATPNLRNDMYLADAAANGLMKTKGVFADKEATTVKAFTGGLDQSTRFIPLWVKVGVAIALGLGTMVGWKRIVVTVGEKIGKTHLTYGQGAAAEIIAAVTIMLADAYKLPVSTTHILSSGVAGTMAANGSGLQARTLLNIALAWLLTLPAAILLAGGLYFILRHVF